MAEKDLYEILGVSKTATDAEIKSRYRQLAKKYHPDLQTGKSESEKKEVEEKFKEINNAYSILSDPEKRRNYDQFGSAEGMGGSGFTWSTSSGDFGGIDDILSGIFGGFGFGGGRRQNPNQPMRGQDIDVRLQISLADAFFGIEKEITIERNVKCSECGGNGAKNGTSFTTCNHCQGKGHTVETVQSIFGQQQVQRTCPYCKGAGKIILEKCKTCKGKGTVKVDTKIKVKVPAGIDSGQVLTYRGEGEPGINGGPNGDVNVIISVVNDTRFERRGYDLHIEVPITITEATLGSKVTIKSIDGNKLAFDIPKGTQTNTVFRMKGKGMKYLQKQAYGDIYARVIVETPQNLTSEQKKLLEKLNESLSISQTPKCKSFRDNK